MIDPMTARPRINRATIATVVSVLLATVALATLAGSMMNHNSGDYLFHSSHPSQTSRIFHFHGNITIEDAPAPVYTTILAMIGGKTRGATEITAQGRYDLEFFTNPEACEYVSFRVRSPEMKRAVSADQRRTLPQSRECLLNLTVTPPYEEGSAGTGSAADATLDTTPTPRPAPQPTPQLTPQPTPPVYGYDPMLWDIVINEIMWDEKEYIELHNTLDHPIEIGEWTITAGTGTLSDDVEIEIVPGAIISAHGYYLIADTDATTCTPDQIANIAMKNGGEVLQLFNGVPATSKRIDVANQNGNWFSGKGDDVGHSMERILPEDGTNEYNWHTSLGYKCGRIGTPGKENSIPDRTPPEITLVNSSIGVSFSEPIDGSTLSVTVVGPYGGAVSADITRDDDMSGATFDPHSPLQVGAHDVTVRCSDPADNFAEQNFVLMVGADTDGEAGEAGEAGNKSGPPGATASVVINELMPNPIGKDRGNETTELYNCGDESVDIGGWVVQNEDGATHEIPAGTIIGAQGYYLTTAVQLDNSDGQVFLYRDSEEIDRSIAYTRSSEGKSWQRRADGLDTDSDSDWVERDPTFGVAR
jgi:hypothetical protein